MKTNTLSEAEYRAEKHAARALSDITDKQVESIANLLRDYDEQQIKYMIFAAQTCIALAATPDSLDELKQTAIEFVADLYKAIDGVYN